MFTLSINSSILVTCPKGMAPYLEQEMKALGYATEQLDAGVRTTGTLADCMRLNLHLRCGHRVHYRLKRFGAMHPDMVYNETNSMPWEEIMRPDGYLSVHCNVSHPSIRDSRFANVRVKDAIADRFMANNGIRPDSGPDEGKGVCIFLYWRGKKAELFLDTTGTPLPKRGYRTRPHRAPMQETLAASVILGTGWKPDTHFINPMCGSGTLAIEAGLMACNIAPGLLRQDFAFRHLLDFDQEKWEEMRSEARKAMLPTPPARIIATDIDPLAIEAARDNAEQAGLADAIEFSVCDFRETEVPPAPGAVVVNPEYGERLGTQENLEEIYAALGDFLKHQCSGYIAGIFTGSRLLAKHIGLRSKSRAPFYNAKIPCTLFRYEMWTGSLKENKQK
ncbi:MAG: THUMP domain-containing class I SAM-dependent RNA methyltransferase [Desulfovibrio sp.]|uniref:THUMP domain-containing class I SAM-dependent RNA methyltransferase n=1 Tax=Desulfovibrio sp. 7SRBS1 TaxID=3378064 RepID=UPI003B3C429A